MKRLKMYRIALIIALFINIVLIGITYLYSINKEIPDSLTVYVDSKSEFDFSVPVEADVSSSGMVQALNISNAKPKQDGKIHFSLSEPFVINSAQTGQYDMELKLFGVVTLKKVSLEVIDEVRLTPCGSSIGIHVNTEGLLVLGTGAVTGADGLEYEPAYQILQTGDYITAINARKISSISEFQKRLNKVRKDHVKLAIRRNGQENEVRLPVVTCENDEKKLGIWVREDTQGIGTLTYVAKDGGFAALGHGITDSDTGVLMELSEGSIFNSEIIQIIKGSAGKPGEIMGMILESPSQLVGTIEKNTPLGISGTVSDVFDRDKYVRGEYPVALRQDIKPGKATILCQLGKKIGEYEVEILDVDRSSTDNKGIVLQITDKKLLDKTGGIIQGMSGAPIIQNGKLAGAVTHVLVNEPTKGYGIFAETMLEQE